MTADPADCHHLTAPQATFGGRPLYDDAIDMAAADLYFLCRNHPFLDGNKRTALAASIVFLRLNGHEPRPDGPDWERPVLDVATGELTREDTTARLRTLVADT